MTNATANTTTATATIINCRYFGLATNKIQTEMPMMITAVLRLLIATNIMSGISTVSYTHLSRVFNAYPPLIFLAIKFTSISSSSHYVHISQFLHKKMCIRDSPHAK